jgi:hypothetical protein
MPNVAELVIHYLAALKAGVIPSWRWLHRQLRLIACQIVEAGGHHRFF